MTSGELTSIASVIIMVFGALGITIDPSLIQGSLAGIVSIIGVATAVWTWYKHRQVVAAQ
jgi:hypothetical protein